MRRLGRLEARTTMCPRALGTPEPPQFWPIGMICERLHFFSMPAILVTVHGHVGRPELSRFGVAIFPGHMAVQGHGTIGVGKSAFIADSPPSEPDVRIYRIRLSG